MPAEDEELIRRLRNQATVRDAFSEVIVRYREPLYWVIRRLVGRHDDTDDLLQNVFMKAWMSIENFRGDARLSTWLYKIAINEAISFLSKERRREEVSLDEAQGAHRIASEEYVDTEELHHRLREAVRALPDKQRLVFNMKYFEDMKYEQISHVLGTSVGALKASYHLAVKKIGKFFGVES